MEFIYIIHLLLLQRMGHQSHDITILGFIEAAHI